MPILRKGGGQKRQSELKGKGSGTCISQPRQHICLDSISEISSLKIIFSEGRFFQTWAKTNYDLISLKCTHQKFLLHLC